MLADDGAPGGSVVQRLSQDGEVEPDVPLQTDEHVVVADDGADDRGVWHARQRSTRPDLGARDEARRLPVSDGGQPPLISIEGSTAL